MRSFAAICSRQSERVVVPVGTAGGGGGRTAVSGQEALCAVALHFTVRRTLPTSSQQLDKSIQAVSSSTDAADAGAGAVASNAICRLPVSYTLVPLSPWSHRILLVNLFAELNLLVSNSISWTAASARN